MGPFRRPDDISTAVRTLNSIGAEMRRLWAEGLSGSAVITAVRDTGERLAGNAVLDLELVVTPDGREAYPARLRMPIGGDDLSPYAVGRRYAVKIDPGDRANLTFAA